MQLGTRWVLLRVGSHNCVCRQLDDDSLCLLWIKWQILLVSISTGSVNNVSIKQEAGEGPLNKGMHKHIGFLVTCL